MLIIVGASNKRESERERESEKAKQKKAMKRKIIKFIIIQHIFQEYKLRNIICLRYLYIYI